MDYNRVHLKAPDYDLDIDGPQHHKKHVNTVVVSVQDHFTLSDLEFLDVAESQAEDHSTEESSTTIHSHSEVSHGNEDLPSGIQEATTTAR